MIIIFEGSNNSIGLLKIWYINDGNKLVDTHFFKNIIDSVKNDIKK